MYYYYLNREESTKSQQNAALGVMPDGAVPLVAGQPSSDGAYFRA